MHTNTTPNYNLPLFEPTDKPTWLGDWNAAMSALDTAIKAASETGSGEGETAQEALLKAQEALQAATDAENKAAAAQSSVSTLSTTVSTLSTQVQNHQTNLTQIDGDISTLTTATNKNSQDIITATQIANAAKTNADTAKTDANSAKLDAAASKQLAGNASSKADLAMTDASSALSTAQSVQNVANTNSLTIADLQNNPRVYNVQLIPNNDNAKVGAASINYIGKYGENSEVFSMTFNIAQSVLPNSINTTSTNWWGGALYLPTSKFNGLSATVSKDLIFNNGIGVAQITLRGSSTSLQIHINLSAYSASMPDLAFLIGISTVNIVLNMDTNAWTVN